LVIFRNEIQQLNGGISPPGKELYRARRKDELGAVAVINFFFSAASVADDFERAISASAAICSQFGF
jgi:hypothetical protein